MREIQLNKSVSGPTRKLSTSKTGWAGDGEATKLNIRSNLVIGVGQPHGRTNIFGGLTRVWQQKRAIDKITADE